LPPLIVTEGAAEGLRRCRRFLMANSPQAASRAALEIERRFLLIETMPDMGHPFPEAPQWRELVTNRGRRRLHPGLPTSERGWLLTNRKSSGTISPSLEPTR
jgi:plasmid stabilization system protein ParE